ncbi:hypothetical protein IAU60_006656 [Kwoniella sp. DSM 27419]
MMLAYAPFLLLLSAGSALGAIVTPANVFTGCLNQLPGGMSSVYVNGDPTVAFTSGTQCNTACAQAAPQSGATHSYFQKSTGTCQCTAKYNYNSQNDYGNADNCANPADYDSRLISTSFHLVGCYSTAPTTGLTSTTKSGPNGCLTSCSKTTQAGFYLGSDPNVYGCFCGAGQYTNQVQCGPGAYFVYQHSLSDASAGLARRRREERYNREQKKFQPCPQGWTACVVPGFSVDTYECIDTSSDLESCGGCLAGTYHVRDAPVGEDCSRGAAIGHSTCVNGQCEISKCKKGFSLIKGHCEKKKSLG